MGEEPIRVMLVDDSGVIRRLVSTALRSEEGLVVVGTATNGQEALDTIDEIRPHVVVLDVEMPVLDGLSTLSQLRPRWPKLPVVMFSTLTQRSAAATLDALAQGANDYVTKLAYSGPLEHSIDSIRQSLVPTVRAWGDIGRGRAALRKEFMPGSGSAKVPTPSATRPVGGSAGLTAPLGSSGSRHQTGRGQASKVPVEVLVIGSSAGGPNALAELIPQLPGDLHVPALLTQHMPETFTKILADRLDEKSRLRVVEGEAGMELEAGRLYVAKGGLHMVVERSEGHFVLAADDGPAENFCKPAVDVMFRSAASVWGAGVLGVVLTGMGRDGVSGASAIVNRGGTVVTQDEETSVVWGMPGAVSAAGYSSANVPLDEMAEEICWRSGYRHLVGQR